MASKRSDKTRASKPKSVARKVSSKGATAASSSPKKAAKKASKKPSPKLSASKESSAKKPATKVAPVALERNRAHRHDQAVLELRAYGLTYPEAHLKSPWPEHLDLAVRDKTFAYLSVEGEPLRLSCKLPQSCQAALDLEFTTPTGYGLGKSGWVTATFSDEDEPPVEFLKTWLDESYRAQAPKSLSKLLSSPTK
jgi:predicted DNA-binding protein (MmcQ/YjbR family)